MSGYGGKTFQREGIERANILSQDTAWCSRAEKARVAQAKCTEGRREGSEMREASKVQIVWGSEAQVRGLGTCMHVCVCMYMHTCVCMYFE